MSVSVCVRERERERQALWWRKRRSKSVREKEKDGRKGGREGRREGGRERNLVFEETALEILLLLQLREKALMLVQQELCVCARV